MLIRLILTLEYRHRGVESRESRTKYCSATGAAPLNDLATTFGFHPSPKTMVTFSTYIARLESTFHLMVVPVSQAINSGPFFRPNTTNSYHYSMQLIEKYTLNCHFLAMIA